MEGQDIGDAPEQILGDEDYEYWVTVRKEYKDWLLLNLIRRAEALMSRPFFPVGYGTLSRYGVAAQFQVPHLAGLLSGTPWAFTHWLVSHTRPVVAASGTRGSGVAAE